VLALSFIVFSNAQILYLATLKFFQVENMQANAHQFLSLFLLTIFFYLYEIKMVNTRSKLRQRIKIAGILLLISLMETCWTYEDAVILKVKGELISDSDTTSTIIPPQERSHARAFFDVSKKVLFMVGDLSGTFGNLQIVDFFECKALLINSYQRNVFYVYASYNVP
jgi:hypothetical protein